MRFRWVQRKLIFSRGDRLRSRYALGPDAVVEESMGTRSIGGMQANGRRVTLTIPSGAWGNDRPMQVIDERWESPELGIVLYSRSSDPRTGVIEYRVTNIQRHDLPVELFVIPDGYRSVGAWINLRYAEPPNRSKGGGNAP